MKKRLHLLGFILAWFAVVAQGVLIIEHREASYAETIIRFFSFFTILTNILVALYFTAALVKIKFSFFQLLRKEASLTPITGFILIVGLVYQLVLRAVWHPTGLQQIVDELLHTIVPLYVIAYWIFRVKTDKIDVRISFWWMLYPLTYLVLIFVRGAISGYYPYPFLDVTTLGYPTVFINIILIFSLMLAVLYGLSFFGKSIKTSLLKNQNK